MSFLEVFGYLASVVVAISLMMKNIRRLRVWNMIGAGTFSLYGGLIGAWPVCVLNGFIALVDLYYLLMMDRHKEYFDLVEVAVHTSDFVKRFLDYYKADIEAFFPGFTLDANKHYSAYFCLRDIRPVSLVILSRLSEEEILVELDYAIPEYRDYKTGRFVYNEGIRRLGLDTGHRFLCKTANAAHQHYLRAQGFKKSGEENGISVYQR